MLLDLPDNILHLIFKCLPLRDLLSIEKVHEKFSHLVDLIFQAKTQISLPDDLTDLNESYPISSYWDNFGPEMAILLEKCQNISCLSFTKYRRMQMFLQPQLFEYFRKFSKKLAISKIHFGKGFVVDKTTFEKIAEIFGETLKILIVDLPYPLVYKLDPSTSKLLESRLENLKENLPPLLDDNNRVTEDLRFFLEIFPNLEELKLKNSVFFVKKCQIEDF